jgi:hypothetical protein
MSTPAAKPYRWLGLPHERQHVFVADRDRSLCQMVIKTPECIRRPDQLTCFWCKQQLKRRIAFGSIESKETL